MNKQEKQRLAEPHSLTCAECGPLDTAERFMRHIYALRGTTPERQREEVEAFADAFVKAWTPIAKELNRNTALALGLPLTDDLL